MSDKTSEHSGTCAAFGCPCYGAIQSSTTGGTDWFCLFHFGRQPTELQAITQVLRENSDVVNAMFRARVADDFEWLMKRSKAAWMYMDRIGKPELQPGVFDVTRKVWDRLGNRYVDEQHRIDETKNPKAWANRLHGHIESIISGRVPKHAPQIQAAKSVDGVMKVGDFASAIANDSQAIAA